MSLYPETIYERIISAPAPSRQVVIPGATTFSFSTEESSATETHDIEYIDLPWAVADILGWSRTSGTGIYRKMPAQHPRIYSLYANKITNIEALGPQGQFIAAKGPDAFYKTMRLTVQYGTPPYRIVGAANRNGNDPFWQAGTSESQRYLQPIDYEVSAEFIQSKRDKFRWPTNSDASQPGEPIPEASGRTKKLVRMKMNFLWVQVPDDGLFAGGFDSNKFSTKIMDRILTVNDASFMGFPKGTLLFEGFKPIPKSLPVPATYMGLEDNQMPRAWDVQLCFSFFDPSPVGNHTALAPADQPRGHNLVLCPNNKWYRILIDAALDDEDNWLYRETDFTKIFEMNN